MALTDPGLQRSPMAHEEGMADLLADSGLPLPPTPPSPKGPEAASTWPRRRSRSRAGKAEMWKLVKVSSSVDALASRVFMPKTLRSEVS